MVEQKRKGEQTPELARSRVVASVYVKAWRCGDVYVKASKPAALMKQGGFDRL